MSHLYISMDKIQRKVTEAQLRLGWPQRKYLYTITCDHVYIIGSYTKNIEHDTEDEAIEEYLDCMEEAIRDDRSICIDEISSIFNRVQSSVKVTEVKEIEWIDPKQLEFPMVVSC